MEFYANLESNKRSTSVALVTGFLLSTISNMGFNFFTRQENEVIIKEGNEVMERYFRKLCYDSGLHLDDDKVNLETFNTEECIKHLVNMSMTTAADLQSDRVKIDQQLQEMKQQYMAVSGDLSGLRSVYDNLDKAEGQAVKLLRNNITLLKESLEKCEANYTRLDHLQSLQSEPKVMEKDIFHSDYMALTILILCIGEIVIASLLAKLMSMVSSKVYRAASRSSEVNGVNPKSGRVLRGVDIVKEISPPKQLLDQVCIISFHGNTQKKLTKIIEPFTSFQVMKKLVENITDIRTIPPCKVALVFVDFNERNIILENPEQELGDLKLSTVKGIQKMGGEVLVLYMAGSSSKDPNSDELYSRSLTSVERNQELHKLSQKQCVLSVHNQQLSKHQIQHVIKKIQGTLKMSSIPVKNTGK